MKRGAGGTEVLVGKRRKTIHGRIIHRSQGRRSACCERGRKQLTRSGIRGTGGTCTSCKRGNLSRVLTVVCKSDGWYLLPTVERRWKSDASGTSFFLASSYLHFHWMAPRHTRGSWPWSKYTCRHCCTPSAKYRWPEVCFYSQLCIGVNRDIGTSRQRTLYS